MLERAEHADLILANKERVDINKDLYRRRQAIVEHPYGIVKRQWGFSCILTKKGKKRASADIGLMVVAFNLIRLINIIKFDGLKEWLKILVSRFFELFYSFSRTIKHQCTLQEIKNITRSAAFYIPISGIFDCAIR